MIESTKIVETPTPTKAQPVTKQTMFPEASSVFGGRVFRGLLQVIFGVLALAVAASLMRASVRQMPPSDSQTTGLKIDLNQATEQEITLVPGVGTVLAKRILVSRDRQGPFESLADLNRVHGVGKRTLERIAEIGFVRETPPRQKK